MKARGMSPEEEAAHWQSVQETLARADRTLEETARRERPAELWEAPQQPPAPAPDPPQPVRRAMAPPMPDKVQIPQHDSSGRVVAIKSFEGQASVSAAVSWEGWVRKEIRSYVEHRLGELADGVGAAMGEMARQERAEVDAAIDDLKHQVDLLARAVELLRNPPAPPRLVGSDAAD